MKLNKKQIEVILKIGYIEEENWKKEISENFHWNDLSEGDKYILIDDDGNLMFSFFIFDKDTGSSIEVIQEKTIEEMKIIINKVNMKKNFK